MEYRHPLHSLHILALRGDVSIPPEQTCTGHAHVVEGDPGIVKIIAHSLAPHVPVGDAGDHLSTHTQVQHEGVGPHRLALKEDSRESTRPR